MPPQPAKFIQIAAVAVIGIAPSQILYALDADGIVWQFRGNKWARVPEEREP